MCFCSSSHCSGTRAGGPSQLYLGPDLMFQGPGSGRKYNQESPKSTHPKPKQQFFNRGELGLYGRDPNKTVNGKCSCDTVCSAADKAVTEMLVFVDFVGTSVHLCSAAVAWTRSTCKLPSQKSADMWHFANKPLVQQSGLSHCSSTASLTLS